MNSPKDPLIELRADGRVAVLSFEVGASSPLTKQFLRGVSKLVASRPKKPLVHTTDRSLIAVYRSAVDDVALRDPLSLRPLFSDIGRRVADVNARIEINATCEVVELPHGGVRADDRTPENTPRHMLPVFDTEAMAQALVDLVERATAAGTVVENQPKVTPAPIAPKRELDISVDPGSFDRTDPRRNDPALIAEIRRRRSELMGGQASDQIDDEALAAVRYRATQRG